MELGEHVSGGMITGCLSQGNEPKELREELWIDAWEHGCGSAVGCALVIRDCVTRSSGNDHNYCTENWD